MESNCSVSVIIPYFNKKETIQRSVESVIAQTWENWEIIIIDDCSEEVFTAPAAWEEYPVKILSNTQNLGAGKTRQAGLYKATGEYIAFLDADDWWSPEFLEKCLKKLVNNRDAAGAWVKSAVYTKNSGVIQRRYSEIPFSCIQETILQYARPWQTGGILWRKSKCGEWGSLSTNEDYQFEFSSSLKSNFIIPVGETLYHVDQATGTHLSETVDRVISLFNTFALYEYVYHNVRYSLSVKSKILLFHRIIRSMFKITESAGSGEIHSYWSRTERMYAIIKLFVRKPFFLRLVHAVLQRTPYRLYF